MADNNVIVTDRPEHGRYEIALDGHVAWLDYRRREGHVILVHTEVPPEFRDRGFGGLLARHALEDARRMGLSVVVRCPFVTAWLRRHREYDDIVTARVQESG